MKLLFDAHAFIWWDENPDKLGAHARAACFDIANELLLSAASVWEMQLKVMLSKLHLQKPRPQLISEQLQKNAIRILPVNIEHVLHLDSLPSHHKDPFDRLLIAQAQVEGCELITHDHVISRYPVKILW